jgi:hypothetical protein
VRAGERLVKLRLSTTFLIGAALASTVAAQSTRVPIGDAAIDGRVIDRATGRPLAAAIVLLVPNTDQLRSLLSILQLAPPSLAAETDADGRYRFEAVGAGDYRLVATSIDYLPQLFDAGSARQDVVVRLAPGQTRTGVDFALARAGAIAGRVVSRDGQPLANAFMGVRTAGGGRTTQTLIPSIVRTNDAGEYLLTNLPEGSYWVTAGWSAPGAVTTNALRLLETAFFPGTFNEREAGSVRVMAGETTRNIDITFPPRALVHISGHISRGSEQGAIEAVLLWGRSSMRNLTVAPSGAFDVTYLEPGRYTIAVNVRGDTRDDAAAVTLDIAADMGGIALMLRPTGSVSGRVVTSDGTAPPSGLQVAAVLAADGEPVDPLTRNRGDVAADGTFTVERVFGERVLQLIGLPPEWRLDRVLRGAAPIDTLHIDPAADIRDLIVVIGGSGSKGIKYKDRGSGIRDQGSVIRDQGSVISDLVP